MGRELLFGIHCHQPVGNFSHVVDNSIEQCYLPFIKEVSKHENFRFGIHFSGWLLEYIEKNSKELFSLLVELAQSGRVEFASGGYYEPILASIPSKDRVEQIRKLNRYIEKKFHQTPKSLWLTERVWEDSVIPDLKKCGIENVFVDDYHFFTAGFSDKDMDGYYRTESGGEFINIFPINKDLRYAIPFKPVPELHDFFEEFYAKKSVGILFDDGEKFGLWPNTHKWVYEDGWLEQFLEFIKKSEVSMSTFAEYADKKSSTGIAYLPSVSYFEMGEWSLPALASFRFEHLKERLLKEGEDIDTYVKGGIWKNFFVKYYESNKLHKRVLGLSRAKSSLKSKVFNEAVLKAECNDVFWHGVFGGLYLPNLRDNAYSFVTKAENERYKELSSTTIFCEDLNGDGGEDIKVVSKNYIASFDLCRGGVLNEFLLRDRCFNLGNTLTRYKEAYHYKVSDSIENNHKEDSEEGIDSIHSMDLDALKEYGEFMVFDSYTKNSFVDHITDYSLSLQNFYDSSFRKYSDSYKQRFDIEDMDSKRAIFAKSIDIDGESESFEANLKKSFTFSQNAINFDISMDSQCEYDLQYLCEMNFHFQNQDSVLIDGKLYEDKIFLEEIKELSLKDRELRVEL
ncbi:MAG: alpha-amylase/4-alpha-glucanotransferase domain-containing protein, partial [Campylobacterales bacterium]